MAKKGTKNNADEEEKKINDLVPTKLAESASDSDYDSVRFSESQSRALSVTPPSAINQFHIIQEFSGTDEGGSASEDNDSPWDSEPELSGDEVLGISNSSCFCLYNIE